MRGILVDEIEEVLEQTGAGTTECRSCTDEKVCFFDLMTTRSPRRGEAVSRISSSGMVVGALVTGKVMLGRLVSGDFVVNDRSNFRT